MDVAFKSRLPSELAASVEAMEQIAGGEVRVEQVPNQAAAMIVILPGRGRIRVSYGGGKLEDCDLAHEMVHGRRNLLERVPRLVPVNAGRFAGWVTVLENDLEHLFVVREEMALFAGSAGVWEERYGRVLAQMDKGGVDDAFARRFDLMRHALLVGRLLPESAVRHRLCEMVEAHNLASQVSHFVAAMADAGEDKARMIAVTARHFPFLRGSAVVERFVAEENGVGVTRMPVALL